MMAANSLPGVILVMSNPQARTEMEEVLVRLEVDTMITSSIQEAERFWLHNHDLVMVLAQSIVQPDDGVQSAILFATGYPDYPFVVLATGDPEVSLSNVIVLSKRRNGENAWKVGLPNVLGEIAFP